MLYSGLLQLERGGIDASVIVERPRSQSEATRAATRQLHVGVKSFGVVGVLGRGCTSRWPHLPSIMTAAPSRWPHSPSTGIMTEVRMFTNQPQTAALFSGCFQPESIPLIKEIKHPKLDHLIGKYSISDGCCGDSGSLRSKWSLYVTAYSLLISVHHERTAVVSALPHRGIFTATSNDLPSHPLGCQLPPITSTQGALMAADLFPPVRTADHFPPPDPNDIPSHPSSLLTASNHFSTAIMDPHYFPQENSINLPSLVSLQFAALIAVNRFSPGHPNAHWSIASLQELMAVDLSFRQTEPTSPAPNEANNNRLFSPVFRWGKSIRDIFASTKK
ncbi:hypothetical protein GGX14DRAFT_401049 [Mycena pura]|uniref:Uncharacterized protein n=1 Tax=Mycena pura TaxID=153505 RepID=A0AAD6V3H6_9AGAR|nr:hypothetical protein GGX14DRAFT_401049 [Mycena pura]